MHMHIVILNKMKDVVELFEKRSSIYSDRLEIPVCKIMYALIVQAFFFLRALTVHSLD